MLAPHAAGTAGIPRPARTFVDVRELIAARVPLVESALEHAMADIDTAMARPAPERLRAAMRYSLLGGGKRLRPLLVIESALASSTLSLEEALSCVRPALVALEFVHTYSLIHDDLPAMDNDVLRRGRPTLHMATDEATAILAGDALLTDAFAVLATAKLRAAEQVRVLALAAGSVGMVAGQIDDVDNEGAVDSDVDLEAIHRRKTGCLIEAACVMGGLAVDADADAIATLGRYGQALGLAFQIADDVLDATSDSATAGKNVGRDQEREKVTYVSRYGVDGARERAALAAAAAAREATTLKNGGALIGLAGFAVERDR